MRTRLFSFFSATCALFTALALLPSQASAVNISIGVGGEVLPGVYGSVNVDNGRYPALVYAEPLIVTRPSRIREPVYLHVPPGHLRKWGRYCGEYGACGRPVYFVKSRDYYDFSPRYIEQRYVYRDRVVYLNPGWEGRGDYDPRRNERRDFQRRDYGHRDDDRRDYRRDDYRGGDRHWKHHDNHGRGHGRHGRGRDD
jgi:hypothetical protein